MSAVQRNNLTFTIEDGLLIVREGEQTIDKVDAGRAELSYERWNIIIPALLANANFSEEEWASMLAPSVAEVTTAPEVEVVAAPVAKKGRRKS